MKYSKWILSLALGSFLLTGCSLNANSNGLKSLVEENVEASLDFEKKYEESLKDYEYLELEIDMEVSDLTIVATKDTQFTFDQKANKEELLASYEFKTDGDTAKITLKNKSKLAFNAPIKNSKATLTVPEHLLISLTSSINVGDIKIEDANTHFQVLESKVDVGNQTVTLEDNGALGTIAVTSDVGDLTLTLKGLYESLSAITATTNVGDVAIHLNGELQESLTLIQESNVGDVLGDLRGTFKTLRYDLSTDTGNISLGLPKDLPVALNLDQNEFTTDVEMNGIAYEMEGENFYFIHNPSKSKDNLFKAKTNVGDIRITANE